MVNERDHAQRTAGAHRLVDRGAGGPERSARVHPPPHRRLDQFRAPDTRRLKGRSRHRPAARGGCDWVSNDRLVCRVYGILKDPSLSLLPVNRLLAVNADGSDHKLLSTASNFYTRGFALGGGNVIDWMPERDGAVLMSRHYLPDEHIGSRVGSSKEGLGVDLLDTRTLQTQTIERPLSDAVSYISDGHGTVRVMGVRGARKGGGQD